MVYINRIILAVLPEGFPETIEIPPYFLQCFDTPGWIWLFRLLLIAVFGVVLCGCWYYMHNSYLPKHPNEEEIQDQEKGEMK